MPAPVSPDVLVVSFGYAYYEATLAALERTGAKCQGCRASDLDFSLIADVKPKPLVLCASALGTDLGFVSASVCGVGLPILGICNGAQILAKYLGANIYPLPAREEGAVQYFPLTRPGLLRTGNRGERQVMMQHDYGIANLPEDCRVRGSTRLTRAAAFDVWRGAPLFGLQYHPEDAQTEGGHRILSSFVNVARFLRRCRLPYRLRHV